MEPIGGSRFHSMCFVLFVRTLPAIVLAVLLALELSRDFEALATTLA